MFSRYKFRKLAYLAYHDVLTGLYNRTWLYENMKNIKYKYVYFIDINGLKAVNKLGHTEGDKYIVSIIKNIKHSGILVRYAGDEFILFSNIKDEIVSNKFYAVGMAIIENSVKEAINIADKNMILNKKHYYEN